VTAEKAAKRKKMVALKRKRAALAAGAKRAMKAAESDPHRLMRGLTRLQLVSVKTEMCKHGAWSFLTWTEPLPESAAAKAKRAEIEAEKRSKRQAKARQREKRRQEKWRAHIRHVQACFRARHALPVKPESADDAGTVPPPPPPVPISQGDELGLAQFDPRFFAFDNAYETASSCTQVKQEPVIEDD
jgi:hypothetical protein